METSSEIKKKEISSFLKIDTNLRVKIDIHQIISKATFTMDRVMRNSELIDCSSRFC